MAPLLGCIADDFTGATDVANMLTRGGLRTVLWFGSALSETVGSDADAVVVALKSRSVPAAEAVETSLAALHGLQTVGIPRILFKYCSTFDSTDRGNIGPVAEALQRELGGSPTIFCPAFPENGRTVYCGHLFVQGRLLNESGMERHPLNPMTDANLVRVLQRQARSPVGLLPLGDVAAGAPAIANRLDNLRQQGIRLVIADAVEERHLQHLAEAVFDEPLVTGGSGIAYWLARHARGLVPVRTCDSALPRVDRAAAILCGSCSTATRTQIAHWQQRHESFAIDVAAAVQSDTECERAMHWARNRLHAGPVLIHSSAATSEPSPKAAAAVERTLAWIARELVASGVRRLIVAGGETSGAVVQSLGVRGLRIGPQIEPGVPWTASVDEPRLALALKSGNFGSDKFFSKALEMLP